MWRRIRYSTGFLLLATVLMSVGCGLRHFDTEESTLFSDTSSYYTEETSIDAADRDLPQKGEYETAKLFDKKDNEVYTISNVHSQNLAIDLPADGQYYLLNIINKGNSPQNISVVADTKSSVRFSCREDLAERLEKLGNSNEPALKASYEAKINFIKATQNKSHCAKGSMRASYNTLSNHSHEVVGQEYTIYTGTLGLKPTVELKRCKLVAMTPNVKYFVDQENHGYSDYDPVKMESWVTGKNGSFSLANIFDTYAYGNISAHSILEECFGNVADVDNDGRLSILFSPILRIWSESLEGLFPYEVMMPDSGDYDGLPALPEYRDLVIVGPIRHLNDNYCRQRILSNMVHEVQHAINFSQRAYSGNSYSPGYNAKCFAEELGFDEGCSVCAEALFRKAWGNSGLPTLYNSKTGREGTEFTGNDIRFSCYLDGNNSISSVFPFDNSNFNYGTDYGRNGLFFLFLCDRFGKANFKRLIRQGWHGNNLWKVIPMVLCGNETSFSELQRDWIFALQNEYLRTLRNKNDEFMISNIRFKYDDWLQLTPANKNINTNSTNLESECAIMYLLESSIPNNESNKYRFFIKSALNNSLENVEVNIIKLPRE